MFKKTAWNAVRSIRKTIKRFRNVKPLCPYPCDYSKVEKVTICGAASPLGEYLAFMLKNAEIIKEISLYDEGNVRGLALDLEHMNTRTKVRPNSGDYALKNALRHSDIVVITNGYEASLDRDEDSRIRENAQMIYKYGTKIASVCPEALVCIITPPINVMVSVISEAMKACGTYDPKKIFGVCSLFEMRASTIVGDYLGLDPANIHVPIIGGATPSTIVPLLSHARPFNEFTDAEIRDLTAAILKVPEECRKLQTTASLSTAYALSRFILTLSAGLCNCDCAIQTAYLRADVLPQVQYFASAVRTSLNGAVENYGIPKIHDFELNLVSQASVVLEKDEYKACCLFAEIHGDNRREEIEEMTRPRKPFITKVPCPPSPPCLPDVCQEKLPEDPCMPSKNKATNFYPI